MYRVCLRRQHQNIFLFKKNLFSHTLNQFLQTLFCTFTLCVGIASFLGKKKRLIELQIFFGFFKLIMSTAFAHGSKSFETSVSYRIFLVSHNHSSVQCSDPLACERRTGARTVFSNLASASGKSEKTEHWFGTVFLFLESHYLVQCFF